MSKNAPQGVEKRELLGLESSLETFQASPEFRGPVELLDGHAATTT